jgi:hypothetical protein
MTIGISAITRPLLFAPLIVSLFTAGIRYTFHYPMHTAGYLGLALAGIGFWITHRLTQQGRLAAPKREATLQALIPTLFVCALVLFPAAYGCINTGNADGGNHIRQYLRFISTTPQEYNGFSGFYSLLYLLEHGVGITLEAAIITALIYAVFLSLYAAFAWGCEQRAPLVVLTLAIAGVVAPIVHYLQSNGFYAHLFSIPVILGYLGLAPRCTTKPVAALLFLSTVAAVRFSYGLNLPDLLLVGALSLLAHRHFVAALPLALAAFIAFKALSSVLPIQGDHREVVTLALIASVGCFVIGSRRGCLARRFVLVSAATWVLFGVLYGFSMYYVTKHALSWCILLALSSALLWREASGTARAWLCASFVLLAVGLGDIERLTLTSVRTRTGPPEVDVRLTRSIRTYLQDHNQEMGYFVSSKWARTNMTNAIFNRDLSYSDYIDGKLDVGRGCLFLESSPETIKKIRRNRFPGLAASLERLSTAPTDTLVVDTPWSRRKTSSVLVVCR